MSASVEKLSKNPDISFANGDMVRRPNGLSCFRAFGPVQAEAVRTGKFSVHWVRGPKRRRARGGGGGERGKKGGKQGEKRGKLGAQEDPDYSQDVN